MRIRSWHPIKHDFYGVAIHFDTSRWLFGWEFSRWPNGYRDVRAHVGPFRVCIYSDLREAENDIFSAYEQEWPGWET